MPRDKLSLTVERKRHFHAFEVYRDLGYGRTYREVARQINASPQSIGKWAELYGWAKRLAEYNVIVADKKATGALLVVDDPIAEKVLHTMEQMEAIIDSAFVKDSTGKFSPKNIKVKDLDELSKFIAEYRKFLEVYHRFVAEYQPAKKEKDRGTHIKELNIHLENLSQEERINLLKGAIGGDESSGDKRAPGGVSEADYTEVPEQRDED